MFSTRADSTRPCRRCGTPAMMLAVWGFFFVANLKVKEDGSGKMTLIYPATPITSADVEEHRFASAASRVTGLQIRDGLARVRIALEDVNRLSEVPEFSNTTVELQPTANGIGLFRATLRSRLAGTVNSGEAATIRVTLPGIVIDSNAQQSSGKEAMWSSPVTQYFAADGIALEASYRTKDETAVANREHGKTARAIP